jgi:hypothetical protein
MALINIHNVYIERLGCRVKNSLALASESICGTPDGHADERLFVSRRKDNGTGKTKYQDDTQQLFHPFTLLKDILALQR